MRRSILLTLVGVVCALALPVAAADSPCADCHDEVAAEMANQIHMRIEPFEVYGRQVGCEGCHGDGTKHMEEGDPSLIRTFSNRLEDTSACLDCHSLKEQGEWMASTHAMENITCLDCHSIHKTSEPDRHLQGLPPTGVRAVRVAVAPPRARGQNELRELP